MYAENKRVHAFLKSTRYVHFRVNTFRKGMNPLIFPAMGKILSLLFLYKDSFGIK